VIELNSPSSSVYEEVYEAPFTGVYQFVGTGGNFKLRTTAVDYPIAAHEPCAGQQQFILLMQAGEAILANGTSGYLYGTRLGDELD